MNTNRFLRAALPRLISLLLSITLLTGCGGGPSGTTGGTASPATASAGAASTASVAKSEGQTDFVRVAPTAESAPTTASGNLKVLIRYASSASKSDESLIASKGGTVKFRARFVDVIAAEVPPSALSALRSDARVSAIEPDLEISALQTSTELANTWGVVKIGADKVAASGNRGTGIKVAVIDTGVDYRHSELAVNYAGGYDFVNKDADPLDDNGHGTHCAGTIAAAANGAGVVGVAPEARIYALKVLDSTGSGNFSNVIAALQWCVDNGIQVTSNSYGASSNPGTTVEDAFRKAEAAGILNLCAAGNNGTAAGTEDNINYPARYASCIAVGATDSSNNRASFSCTGPKLEVMAPGVSIYSTVPGGGYATYSGTSMATPHVSGVVALALKAGYPASQVRSRLQQFVLDLGASGFDNQYGYGLTQSAGVAGTGATNTAPAVTIQSPTANATFSSGSTITFSGSASDQQDGNLSTSLRWVVNGTTYTGASFTAALPDGTYTATASATDAGGLTGSASVTFTVANAAPVVTITAPANNASFASGASITFSGTATDAEDGALTSKLVWTIGSTIIGTGGSFATATLANGTYTVVATATDSKGKSGTASITIKVGAPALSVSVGTDKASYVSKNTATITTTVRSAGAYVASANVTVTLRTANGRLYTATGTTSTTGAVSLRYTVNASIDGRGTYTVTSTASKTGYAAGSGTTSFNVTQ